MLPLVFFIGIAIGMQIEQRQSKENLSILIAELENEEWIRATWHVGILRGIRSGKPEKLIEAIEKSVDDYKERVEKKEALTRYEVSALERIRQYQKDFKFSE